MVGVWSGALGGDDGWWGVVEGDQLGVGGSGAEEGAGEEGSGNVAGLHS